MNGAISKTTIDQATCGNPEDWLFVSGPVLSPDGNPALKVTGGQGLVRDDGTPGQAGDWLSLQGDGVTWQTRAPSKPVQGFETVGVNGGTACYAPAGKPCVFLFQAQVPNS